MEKLWLRCETITVAMEKQWKNRGTMMKKWSAVKQWKNNGKIAALLWGRKWCQVKAPTFALLAFVPPFSGCFGGGVFTLASISRFVHRVPGLHSWSQLAADDRLLRCDSGIQDLWCFGLCVSVKQQLCMFSLRAGAGAKAYGIAVTGAFISTTLLFLGQSDQPTRSSPLLLGSASYFGCTKESNK